MQKEPEVWKDIRGYSKYQVSSYGNIRNIKTGRILKRKGMRKDQVCLVHDNGSRNNLCIITLVGKAFYGKIPDGFHYCRRNGLQGDYSARNITAAKINPILKQNNRKHSRQVARIDRTGEIVEVYGSLKEAEQKTLLSHRTIKYRCDGYYMENGRKHYYQSVFAPDGYVYAWDDEDIVLDVLLKLEEELKDEPVFVDTSGYFRETTFIEPKADKERWLEV